MITIQREGLRAAWLVTAGLVLGCASDAEREMIRVDGEIFESVARAQVSDTTGHFVPAGPIGGGDGPAQGELFRADLREVVLTRLNPTASALRIEWWTPEGGLRSVERE